MTSTIYQDIEIREVDSGWLVKPIGKQCPAAATALKFVRRQAREVAKLSGKTVHTVVTWIPQTDAGTAAMRAVTGSDNNTYEYVKHDGIRSRDRNNLGRCD